MCGYGFAGGGIGSYCFCDDCGVLIWIHPDTEGLPDDEAVRRHAAAEAFNLSASTPTGNEHRDIG